VIRDRQWKGAVTDRAHDIGDGGQGQGQRPHFFLQLWWIIGGRRERAGDDGDGDDQETKHALRPDVEARPKSLLLLR
jgi:hypothetical protein